MRRFDLFSGRVFSAAVLLASLVTAPQLLRAQAAITPGVVAHANDVTFTIPGFHPGRNGATGPDVLLHDFAFNGRRVAPGALHLKTLSDGVFEITSDSAAVGDWSFRIDDSADGYYGLGERFNELNHTHQIIKNSSQDNAAAKGAGTYKPIPFYMSTTGYGLWLDTTSEATFDMNVTERDTVLVSEPAKQLRIVLFAGPQFPGILDHFTALAGRSMLPPYWSFAPWVSRDYHRNDADVKTDIDKTRSLGLPASVILIDSPWTTAYNSYIFNPKQFTDAPGMIKSLHSEGFKLVVWHTSWINSKSRVPGEKGFADKMDLKSSNYDEAASKGYFVKDPSGKPYVGTWWKGQGSLIDFTNPAAKLWWEGQVGKAVSAGADGFKDDDAEGSFQGDVRFADGSDKRLMRNRYAVLYNNAVEDVIQKQLKGNGILFSRSATVGNHNLAMLWGGDNEATFSPENGLPTVVTAGLGAGMSGMALWAADLGGYLSTETTPDPRLFMRWTEYSALSPVMETIGTANLGPWDYGADALANYKKYAILHMSLFPYRYAAAQEAAKTGMPIMRSLVLNYQTDKKARETKDEYLLGPDLLVAPVIDENLSRAVYLPQGEWLSYWTGERAAGGTVVVAAAPLDVLPLYVRAGAVIPKLPEDVMTLVPASESGNTSIKSMDDRRVYELIPGTNASVTTDFEGRTLRRDAKSLIIMGKNAQAIVRWRFTDVRSATVNGKSVVVHHANGESSVEFAHSGQSTVAWQ